MQRSALCRSRRELSNAYLLAKIGVDTAENEPLEVWGENSIQYPLHSLAAARLAMMRTLLHVYDSTARLRYALAESFVNLRTDPIRSEALKFVSVY